MATSITISATAPFPQNRFDAIRAALESGAILPTLPAQTRKLLAIPLATLPCLLFPPYAATLQKNLPQQPPSFTLDLSAKDAEAICDKLLALSGTTPP
jgi:hypothetical protein